MKSPEHVTPLPHDLEQQHIQGLSANDEGRQVLSKRGSGRHAVTARPQINAQNIKRQIVKVKRESTEID
jgi:hypothetical protein